MRTAMRICYTKNQGQKQSVSDSILYEIFSQFVYHAVCGEIQRHTFKRIVNRRKMQIQLHIGHSELHHNVIMYYVWHIFKKL